MGRRGPPPKPSAVKKLEGTYRKDRAARNEVVAPPGAPPLPAKMSTIALAKWNELIPVLLKRGTLSVEDGAILEAHCRSYEQWKRYQALAHRKPMLQTPWGPKVNPAAAEARLWEARVTQTGDRLGLNASARSKVSGPGEKKPSTPGTDPVEEFLFGPDGKPVLGVVEGGGGGK